MWQDQLPPVVLSLLRVPILTIKCLLEMLNEHLAGFSCLFSVPGPSNYIFMFTHLYTKDIC